MALAHTREYMKATPFKAAENLDGELRLAHAAEYTAFYLGEISNTLEKISGQMFNLSSGSTNVVLALRDIQATLLNK